MLTNPLRYALFPLTLIYAVACGPEVVDTGDTAAAEYTHSDTSGPLVSPPLDQINEIWGGRMRSPQAERALETLKELEWSQLNLDHDLEVSGASSEAILLKLPSDRGGLHLKIPGTLKITGGTRLVVPGAVLLEANHMEIEEGAELLAEGPVLVKAKTFKGGTIRAGYAASTAASGLVTKAISISKLSTVASAVKLGTAIKLGSIIKGIDDMKADAIANEHMDWGVFVGTEETPAGYTNITSSYEAAMEEADRSTSSDDAFAALMSGDYEYRGDGADGEGGEAGANGSSGRDADCGAGGYDATSVEDGDNGKSGEDGEDGKSIYLLTDEFAGGTFVVSGGDGGAGGDGGKGGAGGDGADCFWTNRDGKPGGDGGDGGKGGNAGDGGDVQIAYTEELEGAVYVLENGGGEGGRGGDGGRRGNGGAADGPADAGHDGADGAGGADGRDGDDGKVSIGPG